MKEHIDNRALYHIGYGLYAITSRLGERDNCFIANAVMQVTSTPCRLAIAINKANLSHDYIKESGLMNIHTLTVDTPFSLFERFGFSSGRETDKLAGIPFRRSRSGLAVLNDHVSSYFSVCVEEYQDLGTHGLFLAIVEEAEVLSSAAPITYAYYHANTKPKPQKSKKTGYICKICGYIHEGDTLPSDFICPICKHGAQDFERIEEVGAATQNKDDGNTYNCSICGYTYREETGAPDIGIAPHTLFSDLPDSFRCPICGVEKALFEKS